MEEKKLESDNFLTWSGLGKDLKKAVPFTPNSSARNQCSIALKSSHTPIVNYCYLQNERVDALNMLTDSICDSSCPVVLIFTVKGSVRPVTFYKNLRPGRCGPIN
eukprot:g7345.t1